MIQNWQKDALREKFQRQMSLEEDKIERGGEAEFSRSNTVITNFSPRKKLCVLLVVLYRIHETFSKVKGCCTKG